MINRMISASAEKGLQMSRFWLTFAFSALLVNPLVGQEGRPEPDRKVTYKTIGDVQLQLHIFEKKADQTHRPAIVFFFGGGWNGGSPSQFYPHCEHLAKQGFVAMSAEYRVKTRHQTTPFECVEDGKSAVRWIRSHAAELRIDPDRIVAGGGSAGGHVAAAVATVPGLNAPDDPANVSCVPNALVLFNPVYDNGPDGYGYSRVQDRYQEISPMHNIHKGMPPAIVFLGTKDSLIPVATAEAFREKMKAVGSDSVLKLYEGEPHGFFNFGRGDNSNYLDTVAAMDAFLLKHGYLSGNNE